MTLADFRFSRRARRALARLASVVCPGDVETLGLVEAILAEVELTVRSIPPLLRFGFVLGLTIFEWGALLVGGRFSRLPPARAERYFRAWWDSPLLIMHAFAKNANGLCNLAYYEQPAVRERMSYHPDRWIAEAARRRLATYADDIRRGEAEVLAPDPLVPASSLAPRKKDSHDDAA